MTSHGLSFDIEDWHQLSGIRADGHVGDASSSVDGCVARILDLCDELDVKATFFVLGILAKSRPEIVRRIASRGHELASHSLSHRLVHTMTREEFVGDLVASKRLLEDMTGVEVVGYRAPEFSVRRLDNPCFGALREAGFEYDSSVFPVTGPRYGIADAPHEPFALATPWGQLVELPLATIGVGGWRLPMAGGGYFRLLPSQLLTWAAARANKRAETLVYYFHPYEFTRKFLYLSGGLRRNLPIAKHVILHNFATRRIEQSLRAIAATLQFRTLREIARNVAERGKTSP